VSHYPGGSFAIKEATMATGFNGCKVMRQGIVHLKSEIKKKEKDIIERQKAIRRIEDELVEDRAQLNAFEEEVAASCGPA
jgi:hypothetical protein